MDDLQAAVGEVVDPAHASDIEHTNTFVRYGYDEGPMYVLTYETDRRVIRTATDRPGGTVLLF